MKSVLSVVAPFLWRIIPMKVRLPLPCCFFEKRQRLGYSADLEIPNGDGADQVADLMVLLGEGGLWFLCCSF